MDSIFEKAKAFAEEAAKRSQELASQSVKYSQEFAQETAKYSQELASGNALQELAKKSQMLAQESFKKSQDFATEAATKLPEYAQKAAQSTEASFNQLVKELKGPTPEQLAAATGQMSLTEFTDEELELYGITEELREFVRGLTLDTFKEFPVPDDETPDTEPVAGENSDPGPTEPPKSEIVEEKGETKPDAEGPSKAPPSTNVRRDLTDWQARHAFLVLHAVPEMSNFRFRLCPSVMKEKRFWKIYFLLVKTHVKPYEEKFTKEGLEALKKKNSGAAALPGSISTLTKGVAAEQPAAGAKADPAPTSSGSSDVKETTSTGDADIDALLMDALGDDANVDGDDDDEAFDADEFDDLVNSALDDK